MVVKTSKAFFKCSIIRLLGRFCAAFNSKKTNMKGHEALFVFSKWPDFKNL